MHIRVQHSLQNIIYWAGQAAPKVDLPRRHFHLPATLLNKGNIGLSLNITCWAGQVRVFFSLPHCRFLPNSLASYNGASGYVACCTYGMSVGGSSISAAGLRRSGNESRLLWPWIRFGSRGKMEEVSSSNRLSSSELGAIFIATCGRYWVYIPIE